ncbi:unnamed protein product [Owenia fusiformis]|uniref:BAG family molecular chaperone regulator 1 n=1 Tax=Owenia fusiformis TaxID=6347 RepID=A0A8S4PU49_OWEFU|nr:unnamed protein product [Owenia fusiformis]
MADEGKKQKIELLLIHGQKKHEVTVSLPEGEAEGDLTVEQLSREVERTTQVPMANQKLIFKGKSLTDVHAKLCDVGLKPNSKVMLIGKREDLDENISLRTLGAIELDIEKEEKQINDIIRDLDGVEKGYTDKAVTAFALEKLSKQLAKSTERFVKLLENLDAIIVGETNSQVRYNKKVLVLKIQKSLDKCDSLMKQVSELVTKITEKKIVEIPS